MEFIKNVKLSPKGEISKDDICIATLGIDYDHVNSNENYNIDAINEVIKFMTTEKEISSDLYFDDFLEEVYFKINIPLYGEIYHHDFIGGFIYCYYNIAGEC